MNCQMLTARMLLCSAMPNRSFSDSLVGGNTRRSNECQNCQSQARQDCQAYLQKSKEYEIYRIIVKFEEIGVVKIVFLIVN